MSYLDRHKKEILGLIGASFFIGLIGIILGLTPLGQEFEEDIGLSWLFQMRGPQTAPEEVIIISVDRRSATELDVPYNPRLWPRALHAELINRLAKANASVIGFDIFFREKTDDNNDQQLATAIQNAGNVVLFEFLKKDTVFASPSEADTNRVINLETLVLPYAKIAESAAGLAPFPLPKVPAKVSQAWLFKPEAGNVATLPVVMFHLYNDEARKVLLDLILQNSGDNELTTNIQRLEVNEQANIQSVIKAYRKLFLSNPGFVQFVKEQLIENNQDINADLKRRLNSLITSYAGNNSQYLNFYGPRHSIKTIPYFEILKQNSQNLIPDFSDKVVFVGFSEKHQTENKDDFYTAYADGTTKLISGVEIAATLFANLLEQNTIQPIGSFKSFLLVSLWAIILITILHRVSALFVIPAAFILSAIYLTIAHYLFISQASWIPIVIPILSQMPIAVLMIIMWKLYKIRREKQNISKAFGYHLPASVVANLASDISHIKTEEQLMYGICLATDAGQYTTLSENMDPASLRLLMNDYYEAIFQPVKNQNGSVSNIIGDAMLALWASHQPDADLRFKACTAALEIQKASTRFNIAKNILLPTRVGVHCGEVVLGHVGAGSHYEYRAVGDIVNTASRLEGLNKILGTDILVSREIVENLDNVVSCELGRFLLVGKHQAINVYEIQGLKDDIDPSYIEENQVFEQGLKLFYEQNWSEALKHFSEIADIVISHRPANLYLDLCQQQLGIATTHNDLAQTTSNGVIQITKK